MGISEPIIYKRISTWAATWRNWIPADLNVSLVYQNEKKRKERNIYHIIQSFPKTQSSM